MALLLFSILLALSNNLLLHKFENKGLRGIGDLLFFNALISLIWFVAFAIKNVYAHSIFTVSDMWWGIGYGFVISLFLLSKMQALAIGPIAITSFIGCSSFFISTIVGILFWNEIIDFFQAIGLVVLVVALAITISPKVEKSQKTWKYWCLIFFIASGATGIVFKAHQSSMQRESVDQMMLFASITSVILLSVISLVVSKKSGIKYPAIPPKALKYVFACGIVSCGYNRLNVFLAGELPSILFFPAFNGSIIFLATLSGVFLFKEKLKTSQMFGIILGVFALLLTSGII